MRFVDSGTTRLFWPLAPASDVEVLLKCGTRSFRPLVCTALLSVLVYGCGRETANESTATTTATAKATAGLVGPLANDSSDDIVSWVDGQVITDWAAEIGKRDQAIEGYLNDTDPGSGGEVRLPQRAEPPAGVELVPRLPRWIQRGAIRAVQDDHRSGSRAPEPDAAEHRPHLETRSTMPLGSGPAARVDVRSHRGRAESFRLRRRRRAASQRAAVAAAIRIRVREPASVRTAVTSSESAA